ncbi:penicillin acylase family protein, partial [Streptococcus pyogenes]|uniref:penicillin acylase family protein n=1 Tax=Streptococcus pyogenes TaxID=1314 RepID=UPI000EBFA05A
MSFVFVTDVQQHDGLHYSIVFFFFFFVSGALTESGLPLLSNDPHLGAALPSVWHQVGLRCRTVSEDCPFDVAGFGFSGVPGVVIGHNAQIAWGFTNLTADVTDLYLEKIDGDAYWR